MKTLIPFLDESFNHRHASMIMKVRSDLKGIWTRAIGLCDTVTSTDWSFGSTFSHHSGFKSMIWLVGWLWSLANTSSVAYLPFSRSTSQVSRLSSYSDSWVNRLMWTGLTLKRRLACLCFLRLLREICSSNVQLCSFNLRSGFKKCLKSRSRRRTTVAPVWTLISATTPISQPCNIGSTTTETHIFRKSIG
jgi:hypothetical protein